MEEERINSYEKAIDDALNLMDTGCDINDEELEAMMSDEDVIRNAGDLLDIKKATMARSPQAKVDIDAEWKRFETRTRPRHTLLYYKIAGVAAAVILLFGIAFHAGVFSHKPAKGTVLEAMDKCPRYPVLAVDGGDEIELDGAEDKAQLAAMGVGTASGQMTLSANADETPDRLSLTIPRGQTYKLTLADGSEVWMNNDCRLIYPSRFTGKERRVKIEGEAYFKISRDAQHPFIVEANGIEVRVLGTEFNVRSYDRSDVHVTLIKGQVTVRSSENSEARLVPGQDAQLNDDGSIGVADVDIESYLYWRDGYFYYDNIALENVMQDIGRWYNMNVIIENEAVRSYHLHFLADKRGGVDHIIKLLNSMGKVEVSRNGNTLKVK